jgi:branched-chain amino acid transport system permease protein
MLAAFAGGRARLFVRSAGWAGVVGLIAVVPQIVPEYRLYTLLTAAATLIIALGVNLLFGYVGMFSMAHGAFALLGAYVVAVTMSRWHMPFPMALLIAVIVAGLVGILAAAPALRFGTLAVAIATLMYLDVAKELILKFPSVTGGSLGLVSPTSTLSLDRLWYVVAGGAALSWILMRNFVGGPAGRAMKLTAQSTRLAQSLQIPVTRVRLSAVALASVAAAVGGATWPWVNGYTDSETYPLLFAILVIAMVVVGGEGTMLGPVVGVALFTMIDGFMTETFQHGGQLGTALYGAILVAVAVIAPRGIVGTLERTRERHRLRLGEPQRVDESPRVSVAEMVSVGRAREPAPRASVALSVRDVGVQFGGVTALAQVSFDVLPGEVHGLIGPNGAGKTTLLNCISGFVSAGTGKVLMWDTELRGSPYARAKRGLCRTFQTPILLEQASALDNVLSGVDAVMRAPYASYALRTPRARRFARESEMTALSWLEAVGFAADADVLAEHLSPGQRRQVEVARAMASSAQIILMDEPAAGLTEAEILTLGALLRALAESGIAVVLIDHHAEFVLSVSDNVTVLDGGRVIARGNAADIENSPLVRSAYLGAEIGQDNQGLPS